MRWHELTEAPIDLHQVAYPDTMGAETSFRSDDRGILDSPKGVAKIKRLWQSSACDVVAYFIDIGTKPGDALDIAQYGHDSFGQRGDLGSLRDLNIEPTPNAITVLFTNNEGAQRKPVTGWIIAHRLLHAIANYRDHTYNPYHGGPDIKTVSSLLQSIGEQNHAVLVDIRGVYHPGLSIIDIAHQMGASKACREQKLTGYQEFLMEAFAQFMLKGVVKFRELPPQIVSTNDITYSCIQGNYQYSNRLVKQYEEYLNKMFPALINACKGRIFAL